MDNKKNENKKCSRFTGNFLRDYLERKTRSQQEYQNFVKKQIEKSNVISFSDYKSKKPISHQTEYELVMEYNQITEKNSGLDFWGTSYKYRYDFLGTSYKYRYDFKPTQDKDDIEFKTADLRDTVFEKPNNPKINDKYNKMLCNENVETELLKALLNRAFNISPNKNTYRFTPKYLRIVSNRPLEETVREVIAFLPHGIIDLVDFFNIITSSDDQIGACKQIQDIYTTTDEEEISLIYVISKYVSGGEEIINNYLETYHKKTKESNNSSPAQIYQFHNKSYKKL